MRRNTARLATFTLLTIAAQGSSMHNETSIEERRGWVSEPNGRGTATLLYSCSFTMLICTWNALHLNIAAEDDSLATIFLRKTSGMILGLLAPEAIAMLAVKESLDARQLRRTVQPLTKTPYTTTHAMFTLIGGFAVQLSCGARFTLPPSLLLAGDIDLPEIAKEDIQDKSKADLVTKALACLQISWFLAQVIGRAVQGLPLTTLEMFTVAIIICTIATYIAWWNKPFDVQKQITIKLDIDSKIWWEKREYLRYEEESVRNLLDIWQLGNVFLNTLMAKETSLSLLFHFAYVCITLAFSSCHLIAWNFSFALDVEQLLWRVLSVACLLIPLSLLAIYYVMRWYCASVFTHDSASMLDTDVAYNLFRPLYVFTIGLYLLVRMYLIVEVFLSLRSVPGGVYKEVQWCRYIPHF